MLQLHLNFRLNTWIQWIGQRQMQYEAGIIWDLGFDAYCIGGFAVGHEISNCTSPFNVHVIRYPCPTHNAGLWISYQITKIAVCACAGNARDVFFRHRLQKKPLVSDPGMHRSTCVTHVTWCMSGSVTRGGGENDPGILGACATRKFSYPLRGQFKRY